MRFLALNLKKRRQVAETTTTLRRDVSCSSYDWKMLWERLSSECGSREARNSGTGSASAREMKRCWRYARYIEAKTDAGKIIGADGLNPIHVRRRRDGERNFGQSDARDRVRTKSPALIFPLFFIPGENSRDGGHAPGSVEFSRSSVFKEARFRARGLGPGNGQIRARSNRQVRFACKEIKAI